jgi:uncharacterized protein (TIGR02300 family)
MPEIKLGTKFDCFNCGTKFYDMGKPEPLCPKCGANQKDASPSDSPSVSAAARKRRKADVAKAFDVEDDEPIAEIADDEMVGPDLEDDEIADADEEEDFDDEE